MPQDMYKRLAQRLDAIPNGFPPTDSGVELKILEKIFTPPEAELASLMRLTAEPAGDIATRAGLDPKAVEDLLRQMVRQGLIRAQKSESGLLFGLMPFIVGIYESQLFRMDQELASLCEQYFQETGGSMMGQSPSVHRVIPVEESIRVDLEIFPHERAAELIDGAKSWGVRKCICRVQQRLIGKGCEHEVENCLVFAPVEGAFDESQNERAITKEEALRVLRQTEEAGLVHSAANNRGEMFYICNCCICCCGIMRGVVEWGNPDAMARSQFQAKVDQEACTGCGTCLERCQFGALSLADDVCLVDRSRCLGCGLCISACPAEAIGLERLPFDQVPEIPQDKSEWLAQRAKERGIDIEEIL